MGRKRAEELFQVAVDLPIDQRPRYLQRECGADTGLRTDVEQLLRADESDDGSFLRPFAGRGTSGEGSTHERPDQLPTGPASDPPSDPSSDRLTALIGHYQVQRELGRGGMGMVYLALDSKLGRQVALKLLPDEFFHDPHRLALFQREARTAAHLNHPNIATIYELGEVDGSYFIAMEYVEGKLLSNLHQDSRSLPLGEFLDIAVQIAEGLTAAHGSNVVHRDLKPGNLMITNDARVKILDFGLAKALQSDTSTTPGSPAPGGMSSASTCYGTVGYSSPEQCNGEPVDFRSDLFSFGVVLYELATGVSPFTRPSWPDTISAVLHDDPKPQLLINADVPVQLADLIGKLLAKRPEDRYQSSADVLADLEEMKWIRERGRGRNNVLLIAVSASVVLIAVLLTMLFNPVAPDKNHPGIEEFWHHLGQRDMVQAAASLKKLENEISNKTLLELTTQFQETNTVVVNEYLEMLVSLLVDGEFDDAQGIVDRIILVDEGGPTQLTALQLLREARSRQDETDDWSEAIRGDFEAGRFADAADKIDRLKGKQFQGRDYTPARTVANTLTRDLITRLDVVSQTMLDPDVDVSIVDLEATIKIYVAVDPQNRNVPVLRERVDRLNLQTLYAQARAGLPPAALRDILREMERIDREAELANRVRTMYDLRQHQTTTHAEGVAEFGEASPDLLDRAIERYQVGLVLPPNPQAQRELDELRQGRAWLAVYLAGIDAVDDDLDEALLLHDQLDAEPLPDVFHDHASGHRDKLLNEWKERTAQGIDERIKYACDTLKLKEAETALDELRALNVQGLTSMIRVAQERVKLLKDKKGEWDEAGPDFDTFRNRLRKLMVNAAPLLLGLEKVWQDERLHLDTAIALEPDYELLMRRATLLMRLGQYEAALADTHRALELYERIDGFLLRAQAEFARTPGDASRVQAALDDVEDALRIDSTNAQALYLRGVIRHEQFLSGTAPDDAKLLGLALTDLEAAVGEHGLESADASYRLAVISLFKALRPEAPTTEKNRHAGQVIAYARQALEAGLTEEEIIVSFGGNRTALDHGALRRFRRDIHLASGEGYLLRGDADQGIGAFEEAKRADAGSAYSYFRCGDAKMRAKRYDEAIVDFNEAVSRAGDDSETREWATTLRIECERLRDR